MLRPEAALPRVVVLVASRSVRRYSIAVSTLVVAGARGTSNLSSSCLIVPISWLMAPTVSSSCAWQLPIWATSTSVSSIAFSFPSLLGILELEAGGDVELLADWFCERVFRGILWLLTIPVRMILVGGDFAG